MRQGPMKEKRMRLIVLLLLMPTALLAQPRLIEPWQVLTSITAEWNNDGTQDRAVLIQNPDDISADLALYLGNSDTLAMDEVAYLPEIVWSGAMWGQQPELNLLENESLQLHSMNIAIGRNRWHEILTIAYRDEHFVVAGYTYDSYDTLDLDAGGSCDVNYLTGRAEVAPAKGQHRTISLVAGAVALGDWSPALIPDNCIPE